MYGISTEKALKYLRIRCMGKNAPCAVYYYTPVPKKSTINGHCKEKQCQKDLVLLPRLLSPCRSGEACEVIKIRVFIILIIQIFFCSPPRASSPSDPAGCRDDAKRSPPQQQQHSTGQDLELCKYWLHWLS